MASSRNASTDPSRRAQPRETQGSLEAECDRLRAERDASNARFHALVEGNADGIMVVDPSGVVRFANGRAAELFAMPLDHLDGMQFGHPLAGVETTEVDLLSPGRPPVVVEMRAVASEWEGRPATLACLRDITDRKQAEASARDLIRAEALRTAAEEASHRFQFLAEAARAADQAKTDLIAVISHDLRTPLNSIIGYADLLDMRVHDELGDESLDWVRRIRKSAEHQVHLIDQLLTFSRLDSGAETRPTAVHVGALLKEVAGSVEPLSAQRGLRLSADGNAAGEITTDSDMLRQILENLATNAIKYTERGAVTLSAERCDDALVVRVADTGIGIAPEHLDRIFDPFWRVAPGHRGIDGTGLGLSIVRRLARTLGGDIGVMSVPGEGSTFTLTLPPELPLPS